MQKVIGISIIILLMIGGCSQQKEGRQHEKKQEMKVLSGMKNILNTCDVKLFFEIHPKKLEIFQSSASEVVSTLLSYGFKVYEIENVRENNDGITLNPISREKSLMENTMLFSCR